MPYFIRRGQGTDSADALLDNLNQRLEARYRTGLDSGSTTSEKADRLRRRLSAASQELAEDERLVLMIDGLDEGVTAEGLLESLPKELPPRVLAVFSSRDHPRVKEAVYECLDREYRQSLTLAGLGPADVRALLSDSVDKYRLDARYVEEVARRSEGNPLYLRLLCDGLLAGGIGLNDSACLPKADEIYREPLARIARVPGASEVLCLLAAARDYLSPEAIASVLGRDASQVRHQALFACLELLDENPLTAVEDYQLFHESLREHLRRTVPGEVERCDEALAVWCLRWRVHDRDLRAYALRYAVPHLLSSRERAVRRGDTQAAGARLEEATGLLDDLAFREAVFLSCGNAAPLQQALVAVQRVLAADRDGAEQSRIVRYALAYHGEGQRLYGEQLKRIDDLGRQADGAGLEALADLAAWGPRRGSAPYW